MRSRTIPAQNNGGAALPPAQRAQVDALSIDAGADALVVVDGATGEVAGNANVTIPQDGDTLHLGKNTTNQVRVRGGAQPGGGPVDVGGDGTLTGAIFRAFAKALILPFTNAIAWTTGAAVNAAINMTLRPMGERILGLVNGTDRQAFRVYDRYIDDDNYRAVEISHDDNSVNVGVAAAGTGADDVDVNLVTSGAGQVMVNGAPLVPPKPVISLKAINLSYPTTLGAFDILYDSDDIEDTGYDTSSHFLLRPDGKIQILKTGFYYFLVSIHIKNIPTFSIDSITSIAVYDNNLVDAGGLLMRRTTLNFATAGHDAASGSKGALMQENFIVNPVLNIVNPATPLTEALNIKKAEFQIYAS